MTRERPRSRPHSCDAGFRLPGLVAGCLGIALSGPAAGQTVPPPPERPVPRPDLLLPKPPPPVPFTLPRVVPPPEDATRLGPELKVFVRRIEISGNTAVSSEELAQIAAPYQNRIVTSTELLELRNKLSLHYVGKGHVNSGAVLPDQEIKDGVVRYRIVEGALTDIELSGNERLRASYVLNRIRLRAGPPLNVNQLQESLQLLQQSGLIERVSAELVPGTMPGESRLKISVEEARQYQIGIVVANDRSPSVGPYRLEVFGVHRNLTGFGDSIDARRDVTRGIENYALAYSFPVSARDTLLTIRATRNDSLVIEPPFDAIDITSKSSTVSLGLSHPLTKDIFGSFTLGLAVERRKSETFLMGEPFSFSAGIPNGESKVDVLRFSQDLLRREASRVIALRSTLSRGRTNATPQTAGIGPGRHFLSWLGQFQWAQLHAASGQQLIARLDAQWTDHPLMPIEKLAFGGMNTVRGYRENQALRDRGYVLSLEYRYPVFSEATTGIRLYIAPFVDYGRGWNADSTPTAPDDISSAGLGLLFEYSQRLQARLYVGKPFRDIPQAKHDPQDSGVHFALVYQLL